ncbi:MAG TPA: HD domain-containing phosphohydrolase [Candidatus Polarisedimenticolia bacterium]|jgi:diguanylate cyclase (GGDEF)-like protein/putative nucleotidyltransferase with HDIG domain
MRTPPLVVGLAGLGLTLAACTFDPIAPTWTFITLVAICAAGGLIPLRPAGLPQLPLSLPVVGMIAVVGEISQAMTAGFIAGLATALAPMEEERWSERRWLSGWAAAGAVSLAAGIVSSGISTFGLALQNRAFPHAPSSEQVIQVLGICAAGTLMAWLVMRLSIPGSPDRPRGASEILLQLLGAACASMVAATAAIALASAEGPLGEPVVLACLAFAGLGALAMTGVGLGQRQRVRASDRRARTGLALVESIALAIEAKDRTSERHLRRMRLYAVGVGRRLGLPADEIEDLEYAALLHDIGKLVVPESILSKPASLTTEEFQVMSSHAKVGAEILETTSLSSRVTAMVRHHHERYDGSGYPGHLVGLEIPLGARILAAADTFEALTSERPYRCGLPVRDAVSYLERNAGTLFDPRVVRVLVEHHTEFEDSVLAEERQTARAGDEAESLRSRLPGADTRKVTPPLQAVLDRIASSHMEVYSLHEISQVLGKSLNLEESFALIAARIQHLIHFSACAIYLVDSDHEVLRPRFAVGAGASKILEITIPLGQKHSGWAALQGRTLSAAGLSLPQGRDGGRSDLEEIADHPDIAPLRSSLVAPLMVEDALVGVVALYDLAESDYSPQEERLLALIARQVAGAIRTGLLFEQTQEHALTDSLTGLPNSRYMFIAFDQEATKAREEGTSLTLMLMDIDKFREINDDFGHHAGDRFLMGMAKAIRSQLRLCDTCIRYAGDEFVALLPRLAGGEVEQVVERIREAALDYCMEARPGKPVRMSLSIGHATMPADGEDFESLMAAATSRLEEEKSRNRRSPGLSRERLRARREESPAGDPDLVRH